MEQKIGPSAEEGGMRIVVVGGHTGGTSFISQARRFSDEASITLLERGAYVGYVSCGLAYYLGGVVKNRSTLLPMLPETLARRFGVDVRAKHEVVSVDRVLKTVTVRDVERNELYSLPYDKLVLAPGATPARPAIPGVGLPNVFALRRIEDVDAITAWIAENNPRHATVVGGSFIGLEVVENLKRRGLDVTLVERAAQVMPRIDREMAALLHQHLAAHGVGMRLGSTVTGFEPQGDRLKVNVENGDALETDMVVLALGLVPSTSLARDAGLEIGDLGGIKVDAFLRTSDPDIYALGDVVQTQCALTGESALAQLAGPITRQARVAAAHVFGRNTAYKGALGTFICKVFDLAVAMTGVSENTLKKLGRDYRKIIVPATNHVTYYPGAKPLYLKLLFCPETGKVLGAQAVGEEGADKRIDVLATAIASGMTVGELEYLELSYAPPYGAPKDAVNVAGAMAAGVMRGGRRLIYAEDLTESAGDLLVLDVRTPAEFEAGTIPGAVHIPDHQLRERFGELPKDKRIIVSCQIGSKANVMQRFLTMQGFDAYTLMGGHLAWMMVNNCLPVPGKPVAGAQASMPGMPAIREERRRLAGRRCAEDRRSAGNAVSGAEQRAAQDRRQAGDRRRPWQGANLDVRGLNCPGPILKVREQMGKLSAGDMIRIEASDPAFPKDLAAWCEKSEVTLLHAFCSPTNSVAVCRKER